MTDETTQRDALTSRLRAIEDDALQTRAGAYSQVHDELQSVLEGGDSARHDD